MIAGPEEVVHEVEQVVIVPLGGVHDMLRDDAVGVAKERAVAKRSERMRLIGRRIAVTGDEPTEGAEEGEGAVCGIAWGVPDLPKDAEMGEEQGG